MNLQNIHKENKKRFLYVILFIYTELGLPKNGVSIEKRIRVESQRSSHNLTKSKVSEYTQRNVIVEGLAKQKQVAVLYIGYKSVDKRLNYYVFI